MYIYICVCVCVCVCVRVCVFVLEYSPRKKRLVWPYIFFQYNPISFYIMITIGKSLHFHKMSVRYGIKRPSTHDNLW